MSNVNAGDMAIVVRTMPAQRWALGRIVKVGHRCSRCHFALEAIVWCLDEPIYGDDGVLICCEDICLRRIPPLDATETELENTA